MSQNKRIIFANLVKSPATYWVGFTTLICWATFILSYQDYEKTLLILWILSFIIMLFIIRNKYVSFIILAFMTCFDILFMQPLADKSDEFMMSQDKNHILQKIGGKVEEPWSYTHHTHGFLTVNYVIRQEAGSDCLGIYRGSEYKVPIARICE